MRLRSILLLLALPLIAAPALSTEGGLAPVAAALAKVKATHAVNELHDAGPELTPVKHALRNWVERQLPADPKATDPRGFVYTLTTEDLTALSQRLTRALDAAGLTCGADGSPTNRCAGSATTEDDMRGYIDGVSISTLDNGRYLLVVTGVGIRCGYDQSAYIYKHGPDRGWTLLLATERNQYGKDEYAPQYFLSIAASPANVAWNEPAPPPLVATLGATPWCSSNWNMLQTRLWRASDTNPTPAPLIKNDDELYRGDYLVAAARLTQTDLLIEYRGGSVDSGRLIRPHVAHYLIQPGDRLERIAPVALSPNDFVEEWMTSKWPEDARWSDPTAKPAALAALHVTPGSAHIFGDFDGQAKRCRADPTLWQASFSPTADEAKTVLPPVYYKVRWMAPYRFAMVDGGPKPFPGCDEEVAMPDDVGTLFPLQDWKP